MALSDMAGGVNNAIQQMIARRLEQQRYAQQQAQQQFENQRQLKGDARAQQQLDQQGELTRMQREAQAANMADQAQQRTYAEASALGDQLPPQTFLAENDPAAVTMQRGGRGALLTPTAAGMGSAFQGPMPTGETPDSVANDRPRGFLKTPSQKQTTDAQSYADHQADNERQSARDAQMAKYQATMAGIAAQNAATAGQTRNAVADMNALKLQEEQDKIAKAKAQEATDAKNSEETTRTALDLVQRLKTHPGFGMAYGGLSSRFSDFSQAATDAGAIRDQLVASLALPNLGKLKGPMSDKDVLFIKNISTRLGNPRISDAEASKALAEAETFLTGKLGATSAGPQPPAAKRYNPATGKVE